MTTPIRYRQGKLEDSYEVFLLFEESLYDLLPRLGIQPQTRYDEPEKLARIWAQRRGLFEHLARHNEHFWVAEQEGRIVGYARSILHDGVRQLTEFFVNPAAQAGGVGKALLNRAFPQDGVRRRSIIATLDIPAQARYLKAGVYPRFPTIYFSKQPQKQSGDLKGLVPLPAEANEATFDELAAIDRAILTFTRRIDHSFLVQDRQLFLYRRNGQTAGYGYVGHSSGPFGLLNPADIPAGLWHAESVLADQGVGHLGLEVPMINRHAVDYLLSSGFRMDSFIAFVMTDEPFGQFDRYILSTPPFFL